MIVSQSGQHNWIIIDRPPIRTPLDICQNCLVSVDKVRSSRVWDPFFLLLLQVDISPGPQLSVLAE